MDLLNGLNRSVPHMVVMSIIFDILISLSEFHETRPSLAKMDIVYHSVLNAMNKGEKDKEVFGKGCSIFCRLASEARGDELLKSELMIKKLTIFEESVKRKAKNEKSVMTSEKTSKKKTKTLTKKHGCQLTDSIVRYYDMPLLAITSLMKRLRK